MLKNPKRAMLLAEAFKKIILHSVKHAHPKAPRTEWKMVMGMLSGYAEREVLHIENAIPMSVGTALEVSLAIEDYIRLEEIAQKIQSEGHYLMGTYHSKPGLGLYLSHTDLLNLLAWKNGITLVFDHILYFNNPKTNGIKIFSITDENKDYNDPQFHNNYHEIPFTIEGDIEDISSELKLFLE